MKSYASFCILMFLSQASPAFADEKTAPLPSTMAVSGLTAKDGRIDADLTLFEAPTETSTFSLREAESKVSLNIQASDRPVNLWILADVSKMCAIQKFDVYLTSLLSRLPKTLAKGSKVSLLTYTAATRDTLIRSADPSDLQKLKIDCEVKHLSGSFEQPLERLLESESNAQNIQLWVLTSGGIRLEEPTLKKLVDKGVTMELFLYNPAMESELAPVIQQLRSRLGESQVRLHTLNLGESSIPARYYRLRSALPAELQGKGLALKLAAQSEGKEIAVLDFPVSASGINGISLKSLLMFLAVAGLIAYLVYRTVRYYKPKHCTGCQRRLRYEDAHCLFCRGDGDAFLVGQAPPARIGTASCSTLLFLSEPTTEIGSHRRSRLPLVRPLGAKRTCLVRIVKESVGTQSTGYRLIRTPSARQADINLNGEPVLIPQFLASGDTLEINRQTFKFFVKRRPKHARATL